MIEPLVVGIVVASAAGFMGLRLWRFARRRSAGCSCCASCCARPKTAVACSLAGVAQGPCDLTSLSCSIRATTALTDPQPMDPAAART